MSVEQNSAVVGAAFYAAEIGVFLHIQIEDTNVSSNYRRRSGGDLEEAIFDFLDETLTDYYLNWNDNYR